MTDSTDRTLFALFLIIGILAIIVYFSPRVRTMHPLSTRGYYTTTAPASAGTVVRGISPMSGSRSSSYYSSNSSSSTTSSSTPQTTTTTTYQNY